MRAFGNSDQILYTTHSPLFVNAYNYQEVAIASKATVEQGTKIRTAPQGLFDDLEEAKVFKGLSRFNASVNELFFAKKVLVVEGSEDLIAVTSTLVKSRTIKNRTEEINWTILVAGGKESIPFFQRVMNAFDITYSVLHDTDVLPTTPPQMAETWQRTNTVIAELAGERPVHRFPHKLETTLGLTDHLKDQYKATQYFSDPANINPDLEGIVAGIFA
jgi:predicted ATP-dependent endonuclease of OLD family